MRSISPKLCISPRGKVRSVIRFVCIIMAIWTMGAAPVAAASTTQHIYRITIKDLAFGPAPSGIHQNDTVEWVNDDILLHSVTAPDKSFDVDVAPGKQVRIVMKTAGMVRYFCKYHPGMQGELTVLK
jgi:plastocyanin